MELVIENVGKIESAKLKFDGITVVAGENGTGKSTISKALYAMHKGYCQLEENKVKCIRNEVGKALKNLLRYYPNSEIQNKVEKIVINRFSKNRSKLESYIDNIEDVLKVIKLDREDILTDAKYELQKIINNADDYYDIMALNRYVQTEYDGAVYDVRKDAKESVIKEIFHKKYENKLKLTNSKVVKVVENEIVAYDAYYFDARFSDFYFKTHYCWYETAFRNSIEIYNHIWDFDKHIVFYPEDKDLHDKDLFDENLIEFVNENFKEFGYIGEIYIDELDDNLYYTEEGFKETISIHSMAQGAKSIVVLKNFLLNKKEKDLKNSVLILDEPETSLHPKWILALAKLICKMQVKFDMTILICTHNPLFVTALKKEVNDNDLISKFNVYILNQNESAISVEEDDKNATKIFDSFYDPLLKGNYYE